MDQDGQAGNGPGTGFDAIAQLLTDNPGVDAAEPEDDEEELPTSDETGDGDSDEETDAPAKDEDDKSEDPDAEKQASGQKIKVTVKGEDGADETLEVDQQELVAGYQRHRDYTRKTMELADREREAFQTVTTKVQEYQGHYLKQAQTLHAAFSQAAGLRSEEEMMQLASSDPAAWAQETARQRQVQSFLSKIEQSMRQERDQASQQEGQQRRDRQRQTWESIQKDGIDGPGLEKVFRSVQKTYGFTPQELAMVDNPGLVRMMRDAAELHELKAKKAEVTKKVQDAPKLPAARRPAPKSEQVSKQLNQRFKSGKAGLRDLGAYLQHHKL